MSNLNLVFLALFALATAFQICSVHASFSDQCEFNWGNTRSRMITPDSLELTLDKFGGSGLASKNPYLFGSVTFQIKLVPGNSAGTVTTFYLSSSGKNHDEIDFEFLGNATGQPYTIHTNIYTQGFGKREQQFKPWFNPSDGYHNYTISWSRYSVVWYVDSIPIRVFRDCHDKEINYPDSQPMKVYASLWEADDWATQGGRVKTNWTLAPFKAGFQNYNANACICPDNKKKQECYSHKPVNWWNNYKTHSQLSAPEYYKMKYIREKYMIYNYCTDFKRFKGIFPKECNSCRQY